MSKSMSSELRELSATPLLCCSLLLFLIAAGCGETGPGSSRFESTPVTSSSSAADMSGAREDYMEKPSSEVRSSVADVASSSIEAMSDEAEGCCEDAPFTPKNDRQSGLLTAGSFDDVANFSDYVSFLARNPFHVRQCRLPVSETSCKTVIRVRDSNGEPLGNVRCVVQTSDSGKTLIDRRTGTDGRVMFLTTSNHQQSQQQPLRLKVMTDDQSVVADELRMPGQVWDVAVQDVDAQRVTRLDLALVIDTTGSMGDELEYLKTEIDSIVASVHRMYPEVDQRYSLVTYRDKGDEYVCRTFDFTDSLSDFRRHLDSHSAGGGGDFPEAMDVALEAAGQLNWRQGNTARVLFLVGDAPPHQQKLSSAVSAIGRLGDRGVRVFPIGASGVEKTAEVVMRTASLLTMGQYLFLTDHSGVGNPHATPDVPEFAVERLDRLMIRMIASEIAGKRLGPQEIIAIENGENYTWQTESQSRDRSACIVTSPSHASVLPVASSYGSFMKWIAGNVATVALMLLVAVFVFDHLTLVGFTLNWPVKWESKSDDCS